MHGSQITAHNAQNSWDMWWSQSRSLCHGSLTFQKFLKGPVHDFKVTLNITESGQSFARAQDPEPFNGCHCDTGQLLSPVPANCLHDQPGLDAQLSRRHRLESTSHCDLQNIWGWTIQSYLRSTIQSFTQIDHLIIHSDRPFDRPFNHSLRSTIQSFTQIDHLIIHSDRPFNHSFRSTIQSFNLRSITPMAVQQQP